MNSGKLVLIVQPPLEARTGPQERVWVRVHPWYDRAGNRLPIAEVLRLRDSLCLSLIRPANRLVTLSDLLPLRHAMARNETGVYEVNAWASSTHAVVVSNFYTPNIADIAAVLLGRLSNPSPRLDETQAMPTYTPAEEPPPWLSMASSMGYEEWKLKYFPYHEADASAAPKWCWFYAQKVYRPPTVKPSTETIREARLRLCRAAAETHDSYAFVHHGAGSQRLISFVLIDRAPYMHDKVVYPGTLVIGSPAWRHSRVTDLPVLYGLAPANPHIIDKTACLGEAGNRQRELLDEQMDYAGVARLARVVLGRPNYPPNYSMALNGYYEQLQMGYSLLAEHGISEDIVRYKKETRISSVGAA